MVSSDQATRRLFVALRPSAGVVDELTRYVASLADEIPPETLRWSPSANYHVTLRYIGAAPIAPTVAALDRVLPDGPVSVSLGPGLIELGSAIAAPVSGADDLAEVVRRAVDGLGQPRADRPFVGHLTLGRLRRGQAGDGLVGRPVTGRFSTDRVELLASRPPTERNEMVGSGYETIATWPAEGR